MEGFIAQVAARLYKEYGEEISSLRILFPTRRARLFFADSLSQIAGRPLWQPIYTTIDEVMEEMSGLSSGDPVRLMAELYKIYAEFHDETFDEFYFWGEMLLADFDSIDKYLIDADMLFSNISDLKNIENDFSYLTPEQVEIIARFWKSFGAEAEYSEEKQRFITIWQTLAHVYHKFRKRLKDSGLAYTGMIYRAVADTIRAEKKKHGQWLVKPPAERHRYVIAGFNALSECEKRLFDWLSAVHDVDFFWDYDRYYLDDREQEAGLFLRENVRRYPQRLELPYLYDGFSREKGMTVVSAPSSSLQCKYVADFLEGIESEKGYKPDKETAVVLTDESLLMPVLYSIPDNIGSINVTMGYPLRMTSAYLFMERLIELQSRKRIRGGRTEFYHSDVSGLLGHSFIEESDPDNALRLSGEVVERQSVFVDGFYLQKAGGMISVIFKQVADEWRALATYLLEAVAAAVSAPVPIGGNDALADRKQRMEFLSIIDEHIRKLVNSLQNCDIELSTKIFSSLLRKSLQNIRIPYEGEPLQGVQVMGILETRNLDFENVLLLSANDDTFPGNRATSSSFIPYNLRTAYGLPTPLHHEGVYAYYFYRLLQRASNIHLAYSSRADEKSSGEQSRYIYQLEYESPHNIHRLNIGLNLNVSEEKSVTVEKTGEVAEKLALFTSNNPVRLSPTAFYNYVACPLKFYFYSVARFATDEGVAEEIDAPMFGTILHGAAEILYSPALGKTDPHMFLSSVAGTGKVADAVNQAIRSNYLHDDSTTEEQYSGNLVLVKDIVIKYLNSCLLPFDSLHGGYVVEELEKRIGCEFGFEVNGQCQRVVFSGMADRIDRLDGGLVRVVDYKTGVGTLKFKGIESLFSDIGAERNAAALQTLLYAMMINRTDDTDVQPSLYFIRQLNGDGYSPLLEDTLSKSMVYSYSRYKQQLEDKLQVVLAELFNTDIPFSQCEDAKTCVYCDFNTICRRQ